MPVVKVLSFWTPKIIAVIALKFKQRMISFHNIICPKSATGMANYVDPDQTYKGRPI